MVTLLGVSLRSLNRNIISELIGCNSEFLVLMKLIICVILLALGVFVLVVGLFVLLLDLGQVALVSLDFTHSFSC